MCVAGQIARLAVDMKFAIHIYIHIHKFSVDIHEYIHGYQWMHPYLQTPIVRAYSH